MGYVSTSVDIDFWDFMEDADEYDVESFVKDYIENSDKEWVAEIAREALAGDADTRSIVEDPVKRLEVITWLRSNGWKVEPA